jgi:hypothetical protein
MSIKPFRIIPERFFCALSTVRDLNIDPRPHRDDADVDIR